VRALDPRGLPPEVVVRGPYAAKDAAKLMGAVHAVVLPSTWPENQPMVALEARSAGRALIASDIGGMPELIAHEVDGWLVPPGDPDVLRSCLAARMADPDGVRRAADAGTRPPDLAIVSRAYARLYLDALGGVLPAFDPRSTCPSQ